MSTIRPLIPVRDFFTSGFVVTSIVASDISTTRSMSVKEGTLTFHSTVKGIVKLESSLFNFEFAFIGLSSGKDEHSYDFQLSFDLDNPKLSCSYAHGETVLLQFVGDLVLNEEALLKNTKDFLFGFNWKEPVKKYLDSIKIKDKPKNDTFTESDDEDFELDGLDERFVVKRDNEADLSFSGSCLGSVESSPDKESDKYSGSKGRWTKIALYKTRNGSFVCEKIGYTQHTHEHTRYSGFVCDSLDALFEFFGHGWMSKELYKKAGITSTVEVL